MLDTESLLFGTAAQESQFAHWRQTTFKGRWMDPIGGASLWQLEVGSIKDSLLRLQASPKLRTACTELIFGDFRAFGWCLLQPEAVWRMIAVPGTDVMACTLARLHYLRCRGKIPSNVPGQAAYWKKYYNTALGAGTVEEYMASWDVWKGVIDG